MSVNFSERKCQGLTTKKLFGICDDPPPAKTHAYLDEEDGRKWIAVVINEDQYKVTFTAIDHCIDTFRENGKMDQRCDGMLAYNSTVIFVELKERKASGTKWVIDAVNQLRASINHFESTVESDDYTIKKAYVANSEHPKFKESQARRMEQFLVETGYVLRIQNRIILE